MEEEEKFLQSGKILFNIAKDEYKNEFNRSNTLDTKIGIALPIVASYFFLVLQLNNVKKLFYKVFVTFSICSCSFLYSFLKLGTYSISLLMAAKALYLLFRAIFTKEYKVIAPSHFNERKYLDNQPEKFSAVLVTFYVKITSHNKDVTDERVKLYKNGLQAALLSLASFAIFKILFN